MGKHLSEYINMSLEIVYENPGIYHTALAKALGISDSGLSNKMSIIMSEEPPIFSINRFSKFTTYELTDKGIECYKKHRREVEKEKEREKQILENSSEFQFNKKIKTAFIEYTLMNDANQDNTFVQILKATDVSTIADTFSIEEFIYISMKLELLPNEFSSIYNSTNLSNYNPEYIKNMEEIVTEKFWNLSFNKIEQDQKTIIKRGNSAPRDDQNS